MKLNAIRIVLVATSHPGNIGATARAMKTMGLSHLYLVNPQTLIDAHAHALASGAGDLLQQAVITDTLAEALSGCHLIFATSARPREIALPGCLPAACAAQVAALPAGTMVAIVFGSEQSGLSNHDLLHCHYHLHIPTVEHFSSLNLAQAVQIVAYELRMALCAPTATVLTHTPPLATHEDIERFYVHLHDVLVTTEFLNPAHPKRLMERLRRLFNRVQLEASEVHLLRGILTQCQRAIQNK